MSFLPRPAPRRVGPQAFQVADRLPHTPSAWVQRQMGVPEDEITSPPQPAGTRGFPVSAPAGCGGGIDTGYLTAGSPVLVGFLLQAGALLFALVAGVSLYRVALLLVGLVAMAALSPRFDRGWTRYPNGFSARVDTARAILPGRFDQGVEPASFSGPPFACAAPGAAPPLTSATAPHEGASYGSR